MSKFNIVIVTNSYNRKIDLVERSLRHSLQLADKIQQVVFIDQNQKKLPLSSDILEHPKFLLFSSSSNCVSTARNSFPIPADTDWIIFCDDDGYIDSNYIDEFYKIISTQPDLEIIAGSIIRDDNFQAYSPRHAIGGDLMKFTNTKLLMGSNFMVRSNTFLKLEGFDEMFGAGSFWGSGEETDFCWKAYFSNTKMLFNYKMKVFHIRPYAGTFKHSIDKAFKYGRGKGALVFKWLCLKRKPIVLYELLEMTIVPILQLIKGIASFSFSSAIIPLYSLSGRYYGFWLAFLNSVRRK